MLLTKYLYKIYFQNKIIKFESLYYVLGIEEITQLTKDGQIMYI